MDTLPAPDVPHAGQATSRKASAVAGLMLVSALAALVSYWPVPSTPLPVSPAAIARSPLAGAAHVEPPSRATLAWRPSAPARTIARDRVAAVDSATAVTAPAAIPAPSSSGTLTVSWTPDPASLSAPPAAWTLPPPPAHGRTPFEHAGAALARGAAEAGRAFSRSGKAIGDAFR